MVSDDVDFVAAATNPGWPYQIQGRGEPPDYRMGLLYDGFIMPHAYTLGDLNEAEWQIGLDGRPQDPWGTGWTWSCRIPAQPSCLLSRRTRPPGGVRSGTCSPLRPHAQNTPGHVTVVRLKTGGFNHRDERVGWVPVPVFAVVGRTSKDGAATPIVAAGGVVGERDKR